MRIKKPISLFRYMFISLTAILLCALAVVAIGVTIILRYNIRLLALLLFLCVVGLLFFMIIIAVLKTLAKEIKIIGMMTADFSSLSVAPRHDFLLTEIDDLYHTVYHSAIRCKDRIKFLEDMGYTDALTQVHNRLSFDKRIELEFSHAQRDQSTLSFLMIDIDDFKMVNDTYGHQIGDTILRTVAQTIAKSLNRKTDFVARYGGEEFSVILPKTTQQGAMKIAEYIRKNIEDTVLLPGLSNRITISVGVATMEMDLSSLDESIEKLIMRADKALFLAKKESKNCVRYLSYSSGNKQ